MENCIHINAKTKQVVPEGYPNSKAYFSEEAVISIIQEAYEYQCPAYGKKYEEGYSDGNKDACNAIKEAIKKLKGGAK